MTPTSCTFCDSRHIDGYLLGEVAICRRCRDSALSFIESIGIVMADTHCLIRELCEDSHYIPHACWEYHSFVTGTRGVVLRIEKKV